MLKDQTHAWKSEGDQELPTEPIARKEIAPAPEKPTGKELGNEVASGQEELENTWQVLLQERETALRWGQRGKSPCTCLGLAGKTVYLEI